MSIEHYLQIRDSIEDGDFIFFKAESLKQRIICWFTGGKHSHCGIANWLTDGQGSRRLMLVESFVGGCRIISLSSYSSRGMDIVRIKDMDWKSLATYVTDKTGKVHYGTFDFLTIGLRDLLIRAGIKSKKIVNALPNGSGEVCSEMLADVLSKLHPVETTLLSPSTLFKLLNVRKLISYRMSTV